MKYVNTGVVFQEIPDEVTLSINISNCPCHCMGCHSEYLWDDIGIELNHETLDDMLVNYVGEITCVCFMGGDSEPEMVNELASHVCYNYPKMKVGWYSGRNKISEEINLDNFNYIKVGPYVERLGGLDKKTTNQKLYKVEKDKTLTDITSKFWKK